MIMSEKNSPENCFVACCLKFINHQDFSNIDWTNFTNCFYSDNDVDEDMRATWVNASFGNKKDIDIF